MTIRSTTKRWAAQKRAFDLVVALLLLVLLAPLLLLVALVIKCEGGGPVLYRQTRPGLDGKPFAIRKFRSMRPDSALEQVGADADHMRITRVGRILRATSIDELPNLINVVRGEMSIVGPRPHLMSYLELYSERQARRHDVRPGITGLAQVRGRNAIDWATRLDHDVEYVDRCSLELDFRILVATVRTVATGRGVSAPDHATMALFQGNEASADPALLPATPTMEPVGVR